MHSVLRAAALVLTALVTAATLTAPAHADPGTCIDHVMENGHEATDEVLRACKVAKTGIARDVALCRRILVDEGVSRDVARHACRIASHPE